MLLWSHQQNAINSKKNFKKCLINMWCGTGKTRVFTKSILDDNKQRNVIVFPSLGLINQYIKDYINNPDFIKYWKTYAFSSFCSEDEKKHTYKQIKSSTNTKTLLNILVKSDTQKVLILVTYQSFEKFSETIKDNEIRINRLYYDEAHHTVGSKIKEIIYNDELFDGLVDKTEFYTATPVNKNGITMYDRDEPENSDCGPIAFEYTYCQALEDKKCRKYDVCLNLCLKSPETKQKYEYVFESIIRQMLSGDYDYWNVLTFHSGVNETEVNNNSVVKDFSSKKNVTLFKKLFKKIQLEEYPNSNCQYYSLLFKGIHSKTKNKQDIISDFDKKIPGRIYILSSCRTVGEGIDTKWANMEVPVDPTNSFIQESQKIGRITRRPEDNMPNSSLVIPVCVDPVKYKDANAEERNALIQQELLENGDYSTFLNVVSAFKYQYDPELYEILLRYPNMFSPQEIKDNLQKQGLKVEESQGDLVDNIKYIIDDQSIDLVHAYTEKETLENIGKKINKSIEVHTQDKDTPIEYYNEVCNETIHLFRNEDGIYCPIKTKTPKRSVKKPIFKREKLFKVRTHPDLQVLWNISEESLNNALEGQFSKGVLDCEISWNVRNWEENYNTTIEYVELKKEIPTCITIYKERKIGHWCSRQRVQNKKNQLTEEQFKKLDQIHGWYWEEDLDKKWDNKKELVAEYAELYKELPSKSTIYKGQNICTWVGTQKKCFRNDELSNNRIQKLEDIPGWYWENYDDHVFDIMLELVRECVKKNKKQTKYNTIYKGKNIGSWCDVKRSQYKMNKLSDEQIKKIESIPGWRWMTQLDTIWYNKKDLVAEYAELYKELPIGTTVYKEHNITGWCRKQRCKYTASKLTDEKIKHLETIPGWYWEKYTILWDNKYVLVTEYVKKYEKLPMSTTVYKEQPIGKWCSKQRTEFRKKILTDERIKKMESIKGWYWKLDSDKINNDNWTKNYKLLEEYVKLNNELPKQKKLYKGVNIGNWTSTQRRRGKNGNLSDEKIKKLELIPNWYWINPATKSVNIKPKIKTNKNLKIKRKNSEYQELGRKMSTQTSINTNKMFQDDPELWSKYHDKRDFSFKGYKEQEELPINTIIHHLEGISHKLKILDLGCGRNIISNHFTDNQKFTITGYDHVSHNGSIACDISKLPNENESVNICIYSQSLMGRNWQEYLKEGKRVLNYNGEMIICESVERYDKIKECVKELGLHIKKDEYTKDKRWFYLHAING